MMKVITIIMGVLLVVGGIYCIMTPVATYSAMGWLIGLSMVVEGVASAITWNERRKLGIASGWSLAGSIVSIILGVFLLGSFALQFAVDVFIAYLIAVWLIIAGVARVVAAISARNSQDQAYASTWAIQLVLGVLIVILGILYIFNPLSAMIGVGLLMGMSIVAVGVELIACSTSM